MDAFDLRLARTYYRQGFFNVPVAHDRHVRPDAGWITLEIAGGRRLSGHVNRTANRNGTAQIMGGAALRDWFQEHFAAGDIVHVVLLSPTELRLERRA